MFWQNSYHTDRIIYISAPEAVGGNVERLELLSGVKLEGPYSEPGRGLLRYVNLAAGLQVIAPLGLRSPCNDELFSHLLQHGEGVYAICIGVDDIVSAAEKLMNDGRNIDLEIRDLSGEEWASGLEKIKECEVGIKMGTRFLYTETIYPDNLFNVQIGERCNQNAFRLDHVAWVCEKDNFDYYVQEFSALGHSVLDGPYHRSDQGISVSISCNSGLEIITPPDQPHPFADQLNARLKSEGEGVLSVIFGVDDIESEKRRLELAGFEFDKEFIEKDYDEPWSHKTETFRELVVEPVMNTGFTWCQIKYPSDVFVVNAAAPTAPRSQVGEQHQTVFQTGVRACRSGM